MFTINSFAPALTMGLALGTPNPTPTGQTCTITIGQAAVQNGTTFQLALEPSTYCVMIFDIGNVTDANVAYCTHRSASLTIPKRSTAMVNSTTSKHQVSISKWKSALSCWPLEVVSFGGWRLALWALTPPSPTMP